MRILLHTNLLNYYKIDNMDYNSIKTTPGVGEQGGINDEFVTYREQRGFSKRSSRVR